MTSINIVKILAGVKIIICIGHNLNGAVLSFWNAYWLITHSQAIGNQIKNKCTNKRGVRLDSTRGMNFIALTLPGSWLQLNIIWNRAICHNCELLIFFSWAIIKAEKSSSSPGAHRESSIQRRWRQQPPREQRGRGESILAMDGMQKLCSWRRINFMITSLEARWTPSVPFGTEAVADTNAFLNKSEVVYA